jgi:hypothetical protein
MRYHWGLGIGHKYSWEGSGSARDIGDNSTSMFVTPSRSQATLSCHAQVDGENQTHLQLGSEEASRIDGMANTLLDNGALDNHHNIFNKSDELEPEPKDNDPKDDGHSDDGMGDLENEDLGDGDSDSEVWDRMDYDMYDD